MSLAFYKVQPVTARYVLVKLCESSTRDDTNPFSVTK